SAASATKPAVLASKIISMLDPQHAFLINRNKIGSMALAGESLFVLEMQPASYAILAANEAEKAAGGKVVDYRMIGATGRVDLSGSEADVRQAAEAAEHALRSLGGKTLCQLQAVSARSRRARPPHRPPPRLPLPRP